MPNLMLFFAFLCFVGGNPLWLFWLLLWFMWD